MQFLLAHRVRAAPGGTARHRFFRNNGGILLERIDGLTTMREKLWHGRSLYDNFRHYLVSADVRSSLTVRRGNCGRQRCGRGYAAACFRRGIMSNPLIGDGALFSARFREIIYAIHLPRYLTRDSHVRYCN